MKRRLLNVLTLLSLLLCVAVIASWRPSFTRAFIVSWARKDAAGLRYTTHTARITCGGLQLNASHFPVRDRKEEGLYWGRGRASAWVEGEYKRGGI